jgi:hypothetical protein
MFKSKRFLLTVISILLFCGGVFLAKIDPVSLATGIGILLAPYLAAQAYRKSEVPEDTKK